LIGPDEQQAASSATVFDAPESAAAAVDGANSLIAGCSDDIEGAARRLIDEALESGEIDGLFTDVNVDFGERSFPLVGESTHAYRLNASVSALVTLFELKVDVIVFRRGPIIGVLTYATNEDKSDEVEAVARRLEAKMAAAAGTLPFAEL
jgi:hypothetical protein